MKLTKAQRRVLEWLREAEDSNTAADTDASRAIYDHDEIVCQGIECWIGLERTNWRVVLGLLRLIAISDRSDEGNSMGGDVRRFRLNETGRNYLKDETQIDAVLTALRDNRPITWRDGKVVPMDDCPRRESMQAASTTASSK